MKIKTINLTGETKVELNRAYAFIEINNSSDGEILISKEPGIVRGNDDVAILPAKNIVTIGDAGSSTGIKEIYISGNGEVQIIGKDFAEHCFKAPASGGGSDDPDDKHFQLVGTGGIFDASSIDIPNKVWKNLADGNDITLVNDGIAIDGDRVHFGDEDYGIFETSHPKTAYCVFKSVPYSGDAIIFGGWYNSSLQRSEMDIEVQNNNILLSTNGNSVRSDIPAVDVNCVVCVTIDQDNYAVLHINENIIYKTPKVIIPPDSYTGKFYVHMISRSSDGLLASESGFRMQRCDYKFIAFDTEPHSEEIIAKNMEYLKKRFLKNEGA